MGSLKKKQMVVGVVRVVKPNNPNYCQILLQGWGGVSLKKQTVVGVVRVVAIRFNSKGGGRVSLKYGR